MLRADLEHTGIRDWAELLDQDEVQPVIALPRAATQATAGATFYLQTR
jgi:hypothetical protein